MLHQHRTRAADDRGENEIGVPSGMKGVEALEQHEDQKSEASLRAYSGFVQEVFAVLKEENTEEEATSTTTAEASEEEVKEAVGWLHVLQHNQHAITCDLTGDMLGCMISPGTPAAASLCEYHLSLSGSHPSLCGPNCVRRCYQKGPFSTTPATPTVFGSWIPTDASASSSQRTQRRARSVSRAS